ncbi:hypothetical protein LX36DRAFT_586633 [Colletotrichum falcatum]|nr:hypothetical protein LX36DRAFT_586633 [Colletotrichum falcatum]
MQEGLYKRKSRACSILLKALCASAVVVLYSISLVQITWHTAKAGRMHGTRFMKSLANEFITHNSRVFNKFEAPYKNLTYFTQPDAEVERNWHNLVNYQNIRFSKSLMEELGRVDEGIELQDGGFFGSIMVFHHLHCLVRSNTPAHIEEHGKHCLHMLREAVMCQGDTKILTMKWNATGLRPIGNLTSPQECVNWERLMEWVVPNSFDAIADGVLVHPILGTYIC